MQSSSCDLCNRFSGMLLDFYGRWACQTCLQQYYDFYDPSYIDCWNDAPVEPTKMKVTIQEIECDMDDLGLNINVRIFTPDWSIKRPTGPLKIEVDLEIEEI